MKSSKIIDVSKASLVSLKAELSRKQEEVNKAKTEAQASFIHPIPRPKKEQIPLIKDVPDKDAEKQHEDEELHRKSRSVLEAKAKLYDKLMQASSSKNDDNDDDNEYLVNFEQKSLENRDAVQKEKEEEQEDEVDDQHNSDDYGTPSDSEEEWVDYTDCLGRTRRCLKCDLDFVKDKDIQLATSLGFCVDKEGDEETGKQEITGPLKPDLMSSDMRREQLRQKWEQQEELLKDKKDVHYQDVLFDEARTHGVGYFSFAQNEETRRQQQEALTKLREDTQRQQEAAKEVRRRRQAALSARVRAARNRQRARLGLPPEPQAPEPTDDNEAKEAEEERKRAAEIESDKLAKEQEAAKKLQTLRPWDIGKDKRKPFQEMSQEDWVKKKRQERNSEFAPPQIYQEDAKKQQLSSSTTEVHSPQPSGRDSPEIEIGPLPPKRKSLFFSSKEQRAQSSGSSLVSLPDSVYVDVSKPPPSVNKAFLYSRESSSTEETTRKPTMLPKYKKIINEVSNPIEISSDEEPEEAPRGRGTEIAPPPTYEYYGAQPKGKRGGRVPTTKMQEIENSISVGLKFLRKQQEEKDKKPDKGLLDII